MYQIFGMGIIPKLPESERDGLEARLPLPKMSISNFSDGNKPKLPESGWDDLEARLPLPKMCIKFFGWE